MSIKCYYHPRNEGPLPCRGCRLPLCEGCRQPSGLCQACTKTREAVQDLRDLRQVAATKARVASSNTAQLRLALRQVGPLARRGERATMTLGAGRRPLAPHDWQATAMRVDARPSSATQEALARRKAQWTYNPSRVAYQSVKIHRATPPTRADWVRRFLGGFAAALAVVLATSLGTTTMLHVAHRWLGWHGKPHVAKAVARPHDGR
jgi:hypothetical protein